MSFDQDKTAIEGNECSDMKCVQSVQFSNNFRSVK